MVSLYKSWIVRQAVIFLVTCGLSIILAGCTSGSGQTSTQVSTFNRVGTADKYPDSTLTPGSIFPDVTAADVCTPNYSKGVRNVTQSEKDAVYRSYGVLDVLGKNEIDHFIPLELGGNNSPQNLWPEPYEPRPGANEKDAVENALHAEVCANRITLAQAQQIITTDWYAYFMTRISH